MREALHAYSAVVLEAALHHLLAGAGLGEVVTALTGNAAEVVVALALLDGALVILEEEGLEALGASVIRLFCPASEQVVVLALAEDEGVLLNALFAGVVGVVGFAVLHSQQAGS